MISSGYLLILPLALFQNAHIPWGQEAVCFVTLCVPAPSTVPGVEWAVGEYCWMSGYFSISKSFLLFSDWPFESIPLVDELPSLTLLTILFGDSWNFLLLCALTAFVSSKCLTWWWFWSLFPSQQFSKICLLDYLLIFADQALHAGWKLCVYEWSQWASWSYDQTPGPIPLNVRICGCLLLGGTVILEAKC